MKIFAMILVALELLLDFLLYNRGNLEANVIKPDGRTYFVGVGRI